jgi:hypothetical protein
MVDDLGRWAEPGLLVLASLADGAKHGYAITTDVAEQVGVTLGRGRSMRPWRGWRSGAPCPHLWP